MNNNNYLKGRLLSVASLVTPGESAADIGTDHGKLPVYLVKNGIVKTATASDFREAPLLKARENIEKEGLSDRIKIKRADGLLGLKKGEAKTVIISGMGGDLITEILKRGFLENKEAFLSIDEFILSPHTKVSKVRKSLGDTGLFISDERIIKEDDKFYFIIKAKRGEGKALREDEIFLGPCLLKERSDTFLLYLKKKKESLESILKKLPEGKKEKREDIKKRIKILDGAINGKDK